MSAGDLGRRKRANAASPMRGYDTRGFDAGFGPQEEMFGDSGIWGDRRVWFVANRLLSSFDLLPHGLRATKFRGFVATNGRFFRNRSFHFCALCGVAKRSAPDHTFTSAHILIVSR